MKQLGFYFDQTRCIGCETCAVACKDWNDVAPGPVAWRKVSTVEQRKNHDLFVAFLSKSCFHCAEPPCVSVCPTGAIRKREEDGIVLVDRAVCRVTGRCGLPMESGQTVLHYGEAEAPCQKACPAHLSIPGFMALIARGRFKEALKLIRETIPLPSVCGRVCLAPCEKACSRGQLDQPVAIAALKRFVADHVEEALPSALPDTRGKKVAIVGSGPSGLGAAYDLIRKGYGVTIYEASPIAGGMLALGIPSYRLPKDILKRDIDYIQALGVDIVTNCAFGPDLQLSTFATRGYEAVVLAMGAQEGTRLNIPGATLKGTIPGISFLRNINSGFKVEIGKRVIVIGGGNVAIDCSRVAIRLGAVEVSVACLESRAEIPALASEIAGAEEEGVVIHPSVKADRILDSRSKVTGVRLLGVRNLSFDTRGEPHMEICEGTERILPADTVIFALGQKPRLSGLTENGSVRINERGTIVVDPKTLATASPGIFACGDVVTGPSNVIDAIASGQKAAFYVDQFLRGYGMAKEVRDSLKDHEVKFNIPADLQKQERVTMPILKADERRRNQDEVALGYDSPMAVAEAGRCLNCAGHLCKDVCPYDVPQFGNEENPTMQKCDFCAARWTESKKPICVEACPVHAMDAGPLDEIRRKCGTSAQAPGFSFSSGIIPSVVFKSKAT